VQSINAGSNLPNANILAGPWRDNARSSEIVSGVWCCCGAASVGGVFGEYGAPVAVPIAAPSNRFYPNGSVKLADPAAA